MAPLMDNGLRKSVRVKKHVSFASVARLVSVAQVALPCNCLNSAAPRSTDSVTQSPAQPHREHPVALEFSPNGLQTSWVHSCVSAEAELRSIYIQEDKPGSFYFEIWRSISIKKNSLKMLR